MTLAKEKNKKLRAVGGSEFRRSAFLASAIFIACSVLIALMPFSSLAQLSLLVFCFSILSVALGFSVGLFFLIISIAFGNTLAAFLTPILSSRESYQAIVGIPLASLVVLSISALGRLHTSQIQRSFYSISFCYLYLLILFIFGIIGYFSHYGVSVVYYFRYFSAIPLFYLIATVSTRRDASISLLALRHLAIIYCVLIFIEVTFPDAFSAILNRMEFYHIKFENRGVSILTQEDYQDFLRRPIFNLSGQLGIPLVLYRASGPFLHTISSAYFLVAGLVAFLLTSKNKAPQILIFTSLLLLQSKGALFCAVLITSSFYSYTAFKKHAAPVVVALAGALIAGAVQFFLYSKAPDPHVSGLIGGLRAFSEMPIGSGLGAGGNHGPVALDWNARISENVIAGYESAYGVLLHQIGVFVIFLIALAILILFEIFRFSRAVGAIAASVIIIFQIPLLFQEEALSQVSLPLMLAVLVFAAKINVGNNSGIASVSSTRARESA